MNETNDISKTERSFLLSYEMMKCSGTNLCVHDAFPFPSIGIGPSVTRLLPLCVHTFHRVNRPANNHHCYKFIATPVHLTPFPPTRQIPYADLSHTYRTTVTAMRVHCEDHVSEAGLHQATAPEFR